MEISQSALIGLINNLANVFGKNCEIVLHDFSDGFDHTVAHIVNGHISGRDKESCLSTLWFDETDKSRISPDGLNYLSTTPSGHVLKCGSSLLKNDAGEIVGAICINYDITDMLEAQRALSVMTGEGVSDSPQKSEVLFHDVNEMLQYYLEELKEKYGKNGDQFDKKERFDALALLHRKGITQISKSSVHLCEFFGISRGTLYAELGKIRGDEDA